MVEPDLIIGSRFNYADYSRSHYILNKIGNKFITFLFNIIYNTTFTDIYSCYACFKKDLSIFFISRINFSPSWFTTNALKLSDIFCSKYYFAMNRKYLF